MNQKISIRMSLVLVLIAVLVIGGYFIFTMQSPSVVSTDNTPSPSTKTQSKETPTVVKKVSETTSWKTYIDTKYGFSFKYPDSFPFGKGAVVNNAYYVYQVPGPMGVGEITAELVVVPADTFKINTQSGPVKISDLSQILPLYSNPSYKSISFKTESGKNGVKIYTGNNDGTFFAAYYVLQGGYVYEFNTSSKENDLIVSKIATTLNLTTTIDPVIGQDCGGGAMGNGGACPTGYMCKITTYGPPNKGICVRN